MYFGSSQYVLCRRPLYTKLNAMSVGILAHQRRRLPRCVAYPRLLVDLSPLTLY